ncbi:hypothetical protein E4S40_05350 [Algoriphagus kandeliae]|uniref:Uncharacterized protein n=1 Tax=Algoriphagus kandeliae TaxID=2562278 RepID=A0A4Y9QV81_9BACT|nr:DUF6090 family protein [Algoriphagus kandeliae]TFV95648.1 hypothetical protein E4S40_05350 [Algoriphagus kandeliae]
MIKFFRKIRQKLLAENRFSKYLVYAIGEIVLVVIGILIALQINNWNEYKNNEAVVNIYFNQLLQDFNLDKIYIEKITLHLDSNIRKYNDYKKIIELPELPIDSNIYYIGKLDWLTSSIIFQSNTIKTLESSGDIKLLPADLKKNLIALKTLQDRTMSSINFNNELYGERIGYANRFSGGGDFIASNSKNSKIVEYYSNEKRKIDWLFALQNSQEVKTIGEKATLANLTKISEDLEELTKQIKDKIK